MVEDCNQYGLGVLLLASDYFAKHMYVYQLWDHETGQLQLIFHKLCVENKELIV
ncbi:hypothetical protein BDV10DRAFT_180064 [Aspergillus recurvatus]